MSVRDRVIDQCICPGPSGTGLAWDSDTVLTNLLLFETLVADSIVLQLEVPAAVNAFGYDEVLSLVESGALGFHAGWLFSANITPKGPEDTFAFLDEYAWSPDIYCIENFSMADPEVLWDALSADLPNVAGLTKRKASKLADAVSAQLVALPKNYGAVSTLETCAEVLYDASGLRRAVATWLSRAQGAVVTPNDVELSVAPEELDPPTLRIESNLEKALGLSPKEAYTAVGEGLLAVFRLHARIETMKACDAICGLREDESKFFDAKLDFLAREVLPAAQIERFHRVLTIFNLPRLAPAMDDGRLKVKKFIELRDSEECKQFRGWLRNLDDADTEEIEERVASLRAKMGNALHRNEGRAARFIVVNGISFVPLVGPFVSMALSGVDEFVVDRVLPEGGPVAFLSSRYPSLFEVSKGVASGE
jgi:hypothetical protein